MIENPRLHHKIKKRNIQGLLVNYEYSGMRLKDKKHILLVDDDLDVLTHYSELLEETSLDLFDFEVSKTTSGKDALKILETQKIDLLFLDIVMPGVDGLKIIEYINEQSSKFSKLSVFVISGYIQDPDVLTAIDANKKINFVQKPIGSGEINQILSDWQAKLTLR